MRAGRPRLAPEAVEGVPCRCTTVGSQELERELLVGVDVLHEVHGAHAALAELPLDAVPAGEDGVRRQGFCRMFSRRQRTYCEGGRYVLGT